MTAEKNQNIRVRIGPSPTGDPHVGTAYIALFNYAFAKKNNGKFILRIEDTDQNRSANKSEVAILQALKWLGLQWDEGPDIGGSKGPYKQSLRSEIYQEHAKKLIESGHAYWCTCSAQRLAEVRKKQQMLKQPTGYDGRCREKSAAEIAAEKSNGTKAVLRLKTPKDGITVVDDLLRGKISIQNTDIDDQILLKSDGFPTYHLANVVDDHLMEISHVIRGEEWISSTPKHVLLYQYFNWKLPKFCHLPLLRNADKSKVSKRKNPVSLDYFKQAGYLAKTLVNFLGLMAFSMSNKQEKFTLDEFIKDFDLNRVSLGGPVFDLQKLLWLNGRYLRENYADRELVEYLSAQLFDKEYLAKIIPLVKERVEKSEDFISYANFFFCGSVLLDAEKYLPKNIDKKIAIANFEAILEVIEAIDKFSSENIATALKQYCKTNNVKPKEIFMPIRLMVTGTKASPPLFDTMSVLGQIRCKTRIREAINSIKNLK